MLYSQPFRNNLHLSPEGDGGGAPAAGSPAGGGAPAFDASAYVPKAEFEKIQNDYQEFRTTAEQRFQEYDSRLPKPEPKPEPKADQEPDESQYDFSKPGMFQKYLNDVAKYNFNQERTSWEKTQSEARQKESREAFVESLYDAHESRASKYQTENADYDPNKSMKVGNDTVAMAILDSEYSAHIHHYLQKNPDKLAELRKMSGTSPGAAVRYVGRLEAQFENKNEMEKKANATVTARPTKGGFGGGAPTKPVQKTKEQLFAEWRG